MEFSQLRSTASGLEKEVGSHFCLFSQQKADRLIISCLLLLQLFHHFFPRSLRKLLYVVVLQTNSYVSNWTILTSCQLPALKSFIGISFYSQSNPTFLKLNFSLLLALSSRLPPHHLHVSKHVLFFQSSEFWQMSLFPFRIFFPVFPARWPPRYSSELRLKVNLSVILCWIHPARINHNFLCEYTEPSSYYRTVIERMMVVCLFMLDCKGSNCVLQRQCYICKEPFHFLSGNTEGPYFPFAICLDIPWSNLWPMQCG